MSSSRPTKTDAARTIRFSRTGRIVIVVVLIAILAYPAILFWPVTLVAVGIWAAHRFVVRPIRLAKQRRRPRAVRGMKLVEPVYDRHPLLTITLAFFTVVVLILVIAAVVTGGPEDLSSIDRMTGSLGGMLKLVLIGLFAVAIVASAVAGFVRLARWIGGRVRFADVWLEIPRRAAEPGEALEFRLVGPDRMGWRRMCARGGPAASLECISLITFQSKDKNQSPDTNMCMTTVARRPVELRIRADPKGTMLAGTLVVPSREAIEAAIDPKSRYARARRHLQDKVGFEDDWAWTLRLSGFGGRCWFGLTKAAAGGDRA